MNNVMELTPEIAKMIINEMRKGTPPRFGLNIFQVVLKIYFIT